MNKRLWAWRAVLVVGTGITAVYFFLPGSFSQDLIYSLMGTASAGFVLYGIRLNSPQSRFAWLCIAAAGALFTLGDDVYSVYGNFLHVSVPFPSYADALYLSGYPFLFVGVLRLSRSERVATQREENADAAVVSLGVLAISWHFLMNAYFSDPTMSALGMFVTMAYPVMDIALVFILFRSIIFRRSTTPSVRLLAAAMSVMFVGDFTYDLLVLHGSYATGNAVDGAFLLEYVLVAAAALHPSAGDHADTIATEALPDETDTDGRVRVPLLIVAGFVPPGILVVATSLQSPVNVIALGTICILVFGVIFLRLSWLIQRMRAQTTRLGQNIRELESSNNQRQELESDLRHQVLHDPLTGLANRTLFEEELVQLRDGAHHSGDIGAVILLGLDDFKGVNDTFGHLVGDQLLVSIARRLEAITPFSDTVCRLGSDEFLYLTPRADSLEGAESIVKRILDEFREPFVIDSVRLEQRASVGLTMFESQSLNIESVVREADIALSWAKAQRRGWCTVFSPEMQENAVDRFTLVQELRDAIRNGELSMWYQPIVELKSIEIVGFEALMRWHHPRRGWIPPSEFIPLAEQSDLIVALGSFALREAIAAAKGWQNSRAGQKLPYVAVNFSAHQFHQENLVSMVEHALSDLAPDRLIIEITESAALFDLDETLEIIRELKNLGVGFALDDFGTGYSSLSYLVTLHPIVIKIDRSFVSSSRGHGEDDALLELVIDLGDRLGITVLAEGIETEEQFFRLRRLGCELGQGYIFSPAVPADEVPGLCALPFTISEQHICEYPS